MKISAALLLASAAAALAAPSADDGSALDIQIADLQLSGARPLNVLKKVQELEAYNKKVAQEGEQEIDRLALLGDSTAAIPKNLNSSSLATDPRAKEKGYPLPKGVEPSAGCKQCKSSLRFPGNKAAEKYEVGNHIPSLPFKTKTSWAGNVATSGKSVSDNPSLFFWLWGKDDKKSGNDLVIWLNGGPGCSSLGGMLQENGPFLYLNVSEKPFPNPYSWTKSANMLYVEQPVKTGFTTGKTENTNENEVAEQFFQFLKNFYEDFPELKSKNLYITGESYAGAYIPNIANYIYNHGNPFNLKSGIIIDGVVTAEQTQQSLVVYDYAVAMQKPLMFDENDLMKVKQASDKCGVTNYLSEYLQYPPSGKLPDYNRTCDAWNTFYELALAKNPKFNVYNIEQNDPFSVSPLGNPNGGAASYLQPTFFDNYDLQTYIHAPHKKWVQCALNVFRNGTDLTPPPDQYPSFEHNILTHVIESGSMPFIIMQGQLDALIITNGTSVSLQNLTWNGRQGFSKSPFSTPLIDTEGKNGGSFVTERNLTYAIVPRAGHMIPIDAQSVGLAALQTLLGQRTFASK